MTGLLIAIAIVTVLVVALEPAHSRSWRPGFDSRTDRDLARQADELNYLAAADLVDSRPFGRPSVAEPEPSTRLDAPDVDGERSAA